MADTHRELVERLFSAFNHRNTEGIVEICHEEMEFFPYETAGQVGREAPYVGREGLREYLADAAQVWEELQITPGELEQNGDQLLVRGRVYVRSKELGIRDMPAAWIWLVRDGRFLRGEVFPNPSAAEERFAQLTVV
jgi:ketosteroid isomerase-like protein